MRDDLGARVAVKPSSLFSYIVQLHFQRATRFERISEVYQKWAVVHLRGLLDPLTGRIGWEKRTALIY